MSEASDEVRDVRQVNVHPRSPRSRAASRPKVRQARWATGAEQASAIGADHGRPFGNTEAPAGEPGSDASLATGVLGVDPGVNTGIAVWQPDLKRFSEVTTMGAVEAMLFVQRLSVAGLIKLVVIEDARLRKWFGTKGREALQGAGSIKRECAIWIDWLNHHAIPHRVVSPQGKGAKVNAERFTKLTGWTFRTSEHARDAAMLVLGVKA